jgi:hypothetical protein
MALQNHSVAMTELNDTASNLVGVQAPLGRHTKFLVGFGGPDTLLPPCGQESKFADVSARSRRKSVGEYGRRSRQQELERNLIRRAALLPGTEWGPGTPRG